jgi:hypothetical protein
MREHGAVLRSEKKAMSPYGGLFLRKILLNPYLLWSDQDSGAAKTHHGSG